MKVVVIEERIFNQFLMLMDDLILRIERIGHAIEIFDNAIIPNFKPLLDWERYVSNKNLSELLKINRHTFI